MLISYLSTWPMSHVYPHRAQGTAFTKLYKAFDANVLWSIDTWKSTICHTRFVAIATVLLNTNVIKQGIKHRESKQCMHTRLSYEITHCQILFYLVQVQGKYYDLTSYKIMLGITICSSHKIIAWKSVNIILYCIKKNVLFWVGSWLINML